MPNHLHLIVSAGEQLHAIMRDFKRFASWTIRVRLKQEGRETIQRRLRWTTKTVRPQRDELRLWHPGCHPQVIQSRAIFEQQRLTCMRTGRGRAWFNVAEHWW